MPMDKLQAFREDLAETKRRFIELRGEEAAEWIELIEILSDEQFADFIELLKRLGDKRRSMQPALVSNEPGSNAGITVAHALQLGQMGSGFPQPHIGQIASTRPRANPPCYRPNIAHNTLTNNFTPLLPLPLLGMLRQIDKRA